MNKRLVFLAVFVVTLLILVAYSKFQPAPPRSSGFIEADEIRLGSRVGGRVHAVYVQEGQEVEAGTVLIELEPFDLLEREKEIELTLAGREADYQRFVAGFREEEKLQAKAKVEQLQAKLDLLRRGPRKQEIEAAHGRLALAEAEKQLAERNYQRESQLAIAKATSQQALDAAREAVDAASANLIVRQQELELLQEGTREELIREAAAMLEEARQAWRLMQHGYREEEIKQAKAARDATQAMLDAIRQQKEELRIRSPLDGTIEAMDLQPGDMVAAGAPVLSMLDHSHLWVRTYVPQTRFPLHVGDRLRISIDSFPGQRFEGTVAFIARQAEFTPSNVQTPEERSKQVFRIKVDVEDQDDQLRPGMMADVWLDPIGESE